MAPIPLPTSAPQTRPSSLPRLTTPVPGEEGGFCGLTGDQWHLVLLFIVLPCEFDLEGFPRIFSASAHAFRPPPTLSVVLLALLVVLTISWVKQEDIALLWFGAQERAEMTRTGTFLSLHPIRYRNLNHNPPPHTHTHTKLASQNCAKSCSDTCCRRATSLSSRLAPTSLRAITPSSPSSLPCFDVDPIHLEVCASFMIRIYTTHRRTFMISRF